MWLMQRGDPISAKALGSLSLPTLRPASPKYHKETSLLSQFRASLFYFGCPWSAEPPSPLTCHGAQIWEVEGPGSIRPRPPAPLSPLPNILATHTPNTGFQNWGAHYLSISDISM